MDEVTPSGPDPNTDFQAALASAAGVEHTEQTEPDVDTSVSAGLTGLEETQETERLEQSRNDLGQFASADPESSEQEPAEVPSEEGQTAEGEASNPALSAFLEQHGGDPNAALEALLSERDNAQSLIGRQGNELGGLRNELEQLKGYVEGLGQRQQAPAELPLPSDDIVDQLETFQEQRGTRGMMEWVIDNRPELIDTAVQVWYAEDPAGAAAFQGRRSAYEVLGQNEQAAPQQPQVDPVLEQIRQERALGNTIDQVRTDLGIAEEDWQAISDQLVPAMNDDTVPSLIKNAVVSQDPSQQYEGLTNLVQVARSRAVAAATADASQQATKAAADQAKSRKQAAQVATGSLRPAGASTQGEPAEMTSQERASAFKKALLSTEVTSVADGLTGLK